MFCILFKYTLINTNIEAYSIYRDRHCENINQHRGYTDIERHYITNTHKLEFLIKSSEKLVVIQVAAHMSYCFCLFCHQQHYLRTQL